MVSYLPMNCIILKFNLEAVWINLIRLNLAICRLGNADLLAIIRIKPFSL